MFYYVAWSLVFIILLRVLEDGRKLTAWIGATNDLRASHHQGATCSRHKPRV